MTQIVLELIVVSLSDIQFTSDVNAENVVCSVWVQSLLLQIKSSLWQVLLLNIPAAIRVDALVSIPSVWVFIELCRTLLQ